jgi:hypothetical protein
MISRFLPREARICAAPDHTLTTVSLPATREFIASAVGQKSKTTEKANDNRPVVVDPSLNYQ